MDLGFVEPVYDDQITEGPISSLQHEEVIEEESLTTKLGIVFNASSKENGSLLLNDSLSTGPNLTQDLLGVLMRYLKHRITLLANIEKSFPQVVIHEKHRDALRFSWTMGSSNRPTTFSPTRNHFGFASSSFILPVCIQILLEWYRATYPETTEAICRSYYADDVATGASSEEEAERLYREMEEIFAYGSFNLRKGSRTRRN